MYYLDPDTGEILEDWVNPYTGKRVEVMHILNDPVHRFYAFAGGRFAFPWPYTVMGDDLVFRISVFSFRDSVMPRLDYPLHSADNKYQAAELWTMNGRVSEVMNPDITSASCVTSWSRLGKTSRQIPGIAAQMAVITPQRQPVERVKTGNRSPLGECRQTGGCCFRARLK